MRFTNSGSAVVIFGSLVLALHAANCVGKIEMTEDDPTQAELDAYWTEKINYCGEYLETSLKEVCWTFYHGRLTPFRLLGGEPTRTLQSELRGIDMECCGKPCSRWEIKDYCDADPYAYEKPNPLVHGEHALALRRRMDAFWTAEEKFCGQVNVILKIQDMCRTFYNGTHSPLQIPDYTPANKRVNAPSSKFSPSSTYSPTYKPDRPVDINEACCNVTCSNWMVKDFCFWEPSEVMPKQRNPTAQISPTNGKHTSPTLCSTENLMYCPYSPTICHKIRSWCLSSGRSIHHGNQL